jgi:hypothetical protein
MEDLKTNKQLNNTVEDLPRTNDGKIDVEKIAIGKDEKGYIIPDIIFDKYLKELPPGTTNESQSYRAYNGGKLARLENDIEEAAKRGKAGGITSQTTNRARRSIREILEELSKNTVTAEEAELYGLKEGTTLLEAATLAQIRRAMKGDTKAAEYVRDTLGEKPADKIDASITGLTAEDKEMIRNMESRLESANDNSK